MDTELVHPFSPTLSEEGQETTTVNEDIPKQAGSPDNDENKPTVPPAEMMLAPQLQERVKSGNQPVFLLRNFIVHTKGSLNCNLLNSLIFFIFFLYSNPNPMFPPIFLEKYSFCQQFCWIVKYIC